MPTLPDPMHVDEVRKFLQEAKVDWICMRNTNEMLKRYNLVAPLLNIKQGDTVDDISMRAFRYVFESVIV